MAAAGFAALALVPTLSPAHGSGDAGGGQLTGTVNYVGKALPPVLAVCARKLSFTLGNLDDPTGGWQSNAFVVQAPGTEYAGPARITGRGGSNTSCESYSLGGGVVTLEVSGTNPLTGATLACNNSAGDPSRSRPLSGHYTRVATDLTAVVTGACLVNGTSTGQITFVLSLEAVARDTAGGEGVTRSVQSLVTTGSLVRPPA